MSAPVMSERKTAVVGAILVALGPVSLALYTPAMPELVSVFKTDIATVKLTLTIYFAGFTLAQLLCGPLSDALGRRSVTLGFTVLYLVGSVVAMVSTSVDTMLTGRLLQGVGASAGVAISRAIVRDQFTGQVSARIMNMIGLMLAVAPAFSPMIGGLVLETLGWRAIFIIMVLYGVAVGLLALFFMHETNLNRDRAHLGPRRIAGSYLKLLREPRFMRPSIMLGMTLGCLYTLATVLPFVLIERVGLSPSQFGYSMMIQSGSFFLGSIVTRHLLVRFDADRIVPAGMALVVFACLLMALRSQAPEPGLIDIMGPIGLFAFAIAMILPSASTRALHPFPEFAGAASALMGFFQMGGGLIGSFAAVLIGDPVAALAFVVPAMGAIATVVFLLPEPATPPVAREPGE